MISFESGPVYVQKLRERLRSMSDEELVRFGKFAWVSDCTWRSTGARRTFTVSPIVVKRHRVIF